MGVQSGTASKATRNVSGVEFSPGRRAKQAQERFREQVMHIAGGNVLEFKELMASDIDVFLIKFGVFYKQHHKDG
jgi:hypothetical protein